MRLLFFILFFVIFSAKAAATNHDKTNIPSVIIKARKAIPSSSLYGPKLTLTQQQIVESGANTLPEVLQGLGGVQLLGNTANGHRMSITMRGFGANADSNSLFLINGIPITNPDMAPPNLSIIPIREIESVEITAGTESVLYGDQAVAGVINIITQKNIEKINSVSCILGSYHQYGCEAFLSQTYHNPNYRIAASTNHTDNYREHNNDDQNRLIGEINYFYFSGRININYHLANEDMQYPGALTAAQVRQNRRQASNNNDYFKNWNGYFHLNHEHYFNDWQFQTDFVHRMMRGHGVLSSQFNQSRTVSFIKPKVLGKIQNIKLIGGFDFQDDRYHLGNSSFLTENIQQRYGIFMLSHIPLYKAILMIGIRGAQQNSKLEGNIFNATNNRALATTLGITYQFNSNLALYLRRAESFRFPKADENAAAPTGVNSLRTQRGVSFESGIKGRRATCSGEINVYQLNLRDEIAFDPTQTPAQPFGTNRNLAPTIRRGLSLSGKWQPVYSLAIGGQYNYVNARFQEGINKAKRIPLVSEHILLANINYKFLEHWNAYLETIYTGNQFSDNDNANKAGAIGGYTIVNFNLRYHIKNFEASLRMNNIFNKSYYFYTVLQQNSHNVFFYPAPERNIVLIINYLFN